MQKVTIICTGKLKEKFYLDAAAEYAKRLSRFCTLTILELPEERLPESPSPAQIEAALAREADAVRAKLPAGCLLIAMCVEGQERSSEALARYLAEAAARGAGHIVFLIGSSYGMHPSLKQQADLRLSMSPMTFPHHLLRVMLLEQIYRAYQINAGSKYHK
ncbi:23S rRNA (pseudouridine(1915)-N(3))-methyltransferase RlmH [Neopoerus faecalis]|uniref:23S rRNA (pseudouridine(1915)-N(3))-methyltransferase RlmH n=1 Tax=Neopoerus faecalis TaxID=3032125 RepID=UPI002570F039|nr:23S rRNA (pseudouridine(1915)-N(3))-methyltransferase RlmH [Neopoerus faecalis]